MIKIPSIGEESLSRFARFSSEDRDRVTSSALRINELAFIVHRISREKGFWDYPDSISALTQHESAGGKFACETVNKVIDEFGKRNIGEALMLMVTELSEGLEAYRNGSMDGMLTHRKGLEVELADCVIRILDLAQGLGMDLGGAIVEKVSFNTTRPRKHGKKF